MSGDRIGRLRGRLLLTALLPLVAGAVGLAVPSGPVALAAGVTCAGLAAAAVYQLTGPLAGLSAEGRRVLDGKPPSDAELAGRADEIGLAAQALAELENHRQATVLAAQADLTAATAALVGLADAKAAERPALRGEWEAEAGKFGEAFDALAKVVGTTRQRLAVAGRILQGVPQPVAVADERGGVRYLNPAAERLFGRPLAAAHRKPVAGLVAAPVQADPLGRPAFAADSPAAWAAAPGAEGVAAAARPDGTPFPVGLSVVRLPGGDRDMAWCLTARDLTAEYDRLAADRAATREETLRAAWAQAAQLGDAPNALLAQVRLLTGDAKQSGQRDALLPKLANVRQLAAGLDLYFRTVRGLNEVPPRPQPAEFIAGEVARAAADQLAPRLQARGNTLAVSDQGGWVFCDEDRLKTALLGLLAHAAEAAHNTPIGLALRRLEPDAAAPEGSVVFELADAGPALTAEELRALDDPFGGLDTPPLLRAEAGYLPGLLLAHRLAAELGGRAEFDATPAGRLVARLVLPSRPAAPADEPAPAELDGAGPAEELCMGWRLGLPA